MLISLSVKKRFLSIGLLFCLLMLACCSSINKVKELYVVPQMLNVEEKAVHQIDILNLKEAEQVDDEVTELVEPELEEVVLSLEECRALTLENNLDLRVQLINPSIAKETVKQEEARFEAVFNGAFNYSKTDTPQVTLLDGSREHDTVTNLGVSIPLRTGGTINFNMVDNRNSESSQWSILNPYYYTDFGASISQPLLRNAGNRVNTYRILAAQYNSRIVDTRTKLQAIRIIANVDITYWQLFATRKLLEVRKQQYDLAKALFEQTERFVEMGLKPKVEVIRTKASVAEILEAIISAENEVRNKERALKRMLNKRGLNMKTKTVLIPSTLPAPVYYNYDKTLLVNNAIENRMELLELELQLAQDSSSINYLKNQMLPLVTMEYEYNVHGLGAERHNAYDMMKDVEYYDHTFNLQFSMPLGGNEAAKSNYRRAVYERSQRLATRESKEAEIENEVLNQIDKLEANWQRIQATRQTTILRDLQYKTEKKQFELGFSASTDVLDAQAKLTEAQIMEIVAVTEYQIALVDLAYATGTLLGAAKVELEPIIPLE